MLEPSTFAKPPDVTVVADASSLYQTAAQEFSRCAVAAVNTRGRFSVALSGGNTPRGVYSLLAAEPKSRLPWEKIFVFFGDERHVPPDDPESNYKMANEALLSKVPIPQQNIFRVPAELPADEAAVSYDRRLRDFFSLAANAWPCFDLILLGLGDDGHTASLFPGSAALQDASRLVAANWVEKFKSYRITFTYPLINHAAEVAFIVSGKNKAQVVREIMVPTPGKAYPAQRVQPQTGRLLWILDRDAAQLLR